jgi:hypothetical protein
MMRRCLWGRKMVGGGMEWVRGEGKEIYREL